MSIYGQDMSENDFFDFDREISILLGFYRHLLLSVNPTASSELMRALFLVFDLYAGCWSYVIGRNVLR